MDFLPALMTACHESPSSETKTQHCLFEEAVSF